MSMEGGYGDGYVPQRSIYDTMCINQQIDSHHHHHHPGGSIRRDCGGDGSFIYSASGSLRVSRPTPDMFDSQPRSLTPNPSFVRRLDERAIYDSLKLGAQDADGNGCHSPGQFNRSVSPAVSSFSAPGVSSSSTKKHHHHYHHHHGDSSKSRDGRHSWKVLTPPKHLESLELTTPEMMDRGGGYLNPGHYPPPGGQSSSLTSPLISPFSGSPLSSGYHTPVFFSPAKPRPSQSQSLRCSPPHVIQPRHYSQTQSLRLSPPHELRRSPYRAPLVQLSAHDLEQDLRDRGGGGGGSGGGGGGGWGRSERDREWEREREREMERGWAQREWERERERGRLERERARERERRETSTFGTFGYGRQVPLRSDRDSVFLEPEQVHDTTPLLLPQPSPSPSPSPNAAPRMGTCAVGRNRAGSKVGPENIGGVMVSKFDNGCGGLVLVDSNCGPRLVSESGPMSMAEAEIRAGMQRGESWSKHDNCYRSSIKTNSETPRLVSEVKTRPVGRDLEGRVQCGMENTAPAHVHKEGHRASTKGVEKAGRVMTKQEPITETIPIIESPNKVEDKFEIKEEAVPAMKPEIDTAYDSKTNSRQEECKPGTEAALVAKIDTVTEKAREEAKLQTDFKASMAPEPEVVQKPVIIKETVPTKNIQGMPVSEIPENQKTVETPASGKKADKANTAPEEPIKKKITDNDTVESNQKEKVSRSQKSKSSKSSSRTRPGTATGLRPGVLSPRLNRGLGELESTSPAESIESTWPRRIMVRKRTVRQGGAVHNLPILPPLPSVLSALEKRRPHGHLHRPGHFSENPLSSIMNATSMVGRCSLKEPSHSELGQVAGLVGRASLKEQNLEHWRVYRDLDEPRRSRSKEKQGHVNKERTEREEKREKERKDKEGREEKSKWLVESEKENEKISANEGLEKEPKLEKPKKKSEVPTAGSKTKEIEIETQIKCNEAEEKGTKVKEEEQQLEEEIPRVMTEGEEAEVEGGTYGEEGGTESWDAVLEMVTTLWDDGWEKGAVEGSADADSLSGSLHRWPLLRPPIGFGGSHPPSSAASELSLTELERRARELDSDLEHLDLSQIHREQLDLYPESQKERGDMYQTHPGPQREKVTVLTGRALTRADTHQSQ